MLKALSLLMTLLSVVGYFAYPLVQPYFVQDSARVYRLDMMVSGGLGSDLRVEANITDVGDATLPFLQVQRMQGMPPTYSYLRIVSDAGTFYATVFFTSSSSGGQTVSLQRLVVPVSNLNSPAHFYYQGFSGVEVSLGSY